MDWFKSQKIKKSAPQKENPLHSKFKTHENKIFLLQRYARGRIKWNSTRKGLLQMLEKRFNDLETAYLLYAGSPKQKQFFVPPALLNILFDNICLATRWHRPKNVGNVLTMFFRWMSVSFAQDLPKKSILSQWQNKDQRVLKLIRLCFYALKTRCKEALSLLQEFFWLDSLDFLDTFEYFLVANCEELFTPNIVEFMTQKAQNQKNCAEDFKALLSLFTHLETRIAQLSNPQTRQTYFSYVVSLRLDTVAKLLEISGLFSKDALKSMQGEGTTALKNVLLDLYYTRHRGKEGEEEEEKKGEVSSIARSHTHERKIAKLNKTNIIFGNLLELQVRLFHNSVSMLDNTALLSLITHYVAQMPVALLDFDRLFLEEPTSEKLRAQIYELFRGENFVKLFQSVFSRGVSPLKAPGAKAKQKDYRGLFSQDFCPVGARALCMIVATLMNGMPETSSVSSSALIALVFNQKDLLFRVWMYVSSGAAGKKQLGIQFFQENMSSISIIALGFNQLLMTSSLDQFLKGIYEFDKPEIERVVQLFKQLLMVYFFDVRVNYFTVQVDRAVKTVSRALRTMYRFFSSRGFLSPDQFIFPLDWKKEFWGPFAHKTHDTLQFFKQCTAYVPECFPFDLRAKLFTEMNQQYGALDAMSPNFHEQMAQAKVVRVARNCLFQDAFKQIMRLPDPASVRINVEFINEFGLNESGMDYGAMFKEFALKVCEAAFNPETGLFKVTEVEKQLYPNQESEAIIGKSHLQRFFFSGLMLAKAVQQGVLINVFFARFFLMKLLLRPALLDDVESLDPAIYKHLSFLRGCEDVESLCLNFTYTEDLEMTTGEKKEVELIPKGRDTDVTEKNRFKYIYLVSNYLLNRRIKAQSEAFVKGFHSVIPPSQLRFFNDAELQMLISGCARGEPLNIDEWEHQTRYSNCIRGGKFSKNFWKAVRSMSNEDQFKLLRFSTGCPRPPLLGFNAMSPPFTLHCESVKKDSEKLPNASTCFNVLKVPSYSSYKVMKQKLELVIHSDAGFELV